MRVMGVDPGLVTTGYGIVDAEGSGLALVEGGIIRCGQAATPLESRLEILFQGIMEVLAEYAPTAMALEELYSHYAFPATAILMGHARGVICLAASRSSVPLYHYGATQVKSLLTGSGRAAKTQIQRTVRARLNLNSLPGPHDVADALALALCHVEVGRSNLLRLSGHGGYDDELQRDAFRRGMEPGPKNP